MGARIEYSSNNSGGDWWLNDEQWYALEAAGWDVHWVKDDPDGFMRNGDRFLGALATDASRSGLSLRDAIDEWESVTGERASALGCSCCGTPHEFTEYDADDKWVGYYTPSYPEYGDDW